LTFRNSPQQYPNQSYFKQNISHLFMKNEDSFLLNLTEDRDFSWGSISADNIDFQDGSKYYWSNAAGVTLTKGVLHFSSTPLSTLFWSSTAKINEERNNNHGDGDGDGDDDDDQAKLSSTSHQKNHSKGILKVYSLSLKDPLDQEIGEIQFMRIPYLPFTTIFTFSNPDGEIVASARYLHLFSTRVSFTTLEDEPFAEIRGKKLSGFLKEYFVSYDNNKSAVHPAFIANSMMIVYQMEQRIPSLMKCIQSLIKKFFPLNKVMQ
jgi:hypothetical protein